MCLIFLFECNNNFSKLLKILLEMSVYIIYLERLESMKERLFIIDVDKFGFSCLFCYLLVL